VTVLLDNEGSLAPPAQGPQPDAVSARQKGVRLGVKLIFSSVVLFPIFLAISLSPSTNSPGPLLVPLTVFLLGLTRMLYSVIFEQERASTKYKPQYLQPRPVNQQAALPPPPASVTNSRRINTGDMAPSPSVTENTTRLLDNE
jgi:hypothetical protein